MSSSPRIENETEVAGPPNERRSWVERILIGACLGAFLGILHLWFYEFSLIRLLAAASGGATFFAVVGLFCEHLAERNFKRLLIGALAGCVAGVAWWAIAQPPSSILLSVSTGIISGAVMIWWEISP